MATNVVLVRWAEGFHEVKHQGSIDAIGRREALLALGAIENIDEVNRVAGMQLSVVAFPRTAIAADLAPIDYSDRPYRAFNVADTITVPDYGGGTIGQRVRAITGAEDDNGEVTYSPELGDLILEEQERTLQAVKKMADGTLEGDSPVAQPPLRPQILRVWTTPASPAGGSFTAETTAPPFSPASHVLRGVPPGDGTYTFTDFWCRTTTAGDASEIPVEVDVYQLDPDGDVQVGHLFLGNNYPADIIAGGTIITDEVVFDPDHGIQFRQAGNSTGDLYVAAEFEGGGTIVTVIWDAPTMRVNQRPS